MSRSRRKYKRSTEVLDLHGLSSTLQVSYSTVKRWIGKGMPTLGTHRTRRCLLVDPVAVESWARARRYIALRRTSFVYFAREDGGPVKIGFSSNVEERLREIARKTHRPLRLLASFPGGAMDERRMHARFAAHRIPGGEWFHAVPELLDFAIAHSTEAP